MVDKTGLKGEYDMRLKFRPEADGPIGGLAPPLSTTGTLCQTWPPWASRFASSWVSDSN